MNIVYCWYLPSLKITFVTDEHQLLRQFRKTYQWGTQYTEQFSARSCEVLAEHSHSLFSRF